MKELLINKPEWLYEPDDKKSLAKVLEHRLFNRQTDYKTFPNWFELAETLENIMLKIVSY